MATGSATHNLTFVYSQDGSGRYGNMTCQTNGNTQGLCNNVAFSGVTNRVTTTGYGYDAAGDLTQNPSTNPASTYTWDAEGRLSSVVQNGTTYSTQIYNAFGQQVDSSFPGFNIAVDGVVDPSGRELGGFNGGTGDWWDRDIWVAGRMVAQSFVSLTYFLHANALHSDVQITNHTGALVADVLYYPWGPLWTSGGYLGDSHFAGFEQGNGPYNVTPTRDYSNTTGRWLTPDPLPWLGWQHGNKEEREKFADFILNPQNLNMYSYVDNNPVSKTDPTGMEGCQAGDKKFTACTITIVYDPKTSEGTLTVTGQNKGDKDPTVLLTSGVVVGGNGHVTPTGTFTATVWEKDHVSTKYGSAADTPYSKTILGGNAFGPYQLHMKELDSRGIYIHGTMGPSWSPVTWGNSIFLSPTSHGCVRMCNADDVKLHDMMPSPGGNKVVISAQPEPED